jgi:hypothetical protein
MPELSNSSMHDRPLAKESSGRVTAAHIPSQFGDSFAPMITTRSDS